MPPKEQKKQHERLGSLGSMGSREGNDTPAMAARFRPKNFAKPAQVKTEEAGPSSVGAGAEVVKQEPVSPRASHRKSPQRLNRGNREVMQDTVTFGGGIGAASKGPRRTVTKGNEDIKPSAAPKKSPGSTQKRGAKDVEMEVSVKMEDTSDVHTSSSKSSSDSDEEMAEGLYRPTIVQPPADMPRDVGDIDTAEHAEASERISSLFTDTSSEGNLMLFQFPEKLPIIKQKNNRVLMNETTQCCSLSDMPNRVIGKLLITRSGLVKMKIGDVIFDVNKGMECRGRQELAFVDKSHNNLVMLGSVGDRITVSPDMDSLLDGMGSSDTE